MEGVTYLFLILASEGLVNAYINNLSHRKFKSKDMIVEFLHNDLSTTLDRFSALIEGEGASYSQEELPGRQRRSGGQTTYASDRRV